MKEIVEYVKSAPSKELQKVSVVLGFIAIGLLFASFVEG